MVKTYLDWALKEAPRLYTLLDANPFSSTYGCMDRKYWKYKLVDYINARCQEAALSFALLYSTRYKDNFWYNGERAKEAAISCMTFWARAQNRDGSFDEYLPNEHSHVATAFSLYSIARAYEVLKINDETLVNTMKKSAEWLNKNDDLVVINHDAGAAAALQIIYELTNERKFKEYARIKIHKVLSHQNEEGWFYEYGGADVGYQSFTIYYLADYWKRTGDKEVFDALKKAVDFFSYFIHPDFSVGGQYGSRETTYCIPAGFEILKKVVPLAGAVSDAFKHGLSRKRMVGPYSFDDLFLADELYAFLDYTDMRNNNMELLPKDRKPFVKYFENSGLYVRKTKKHYLIINLKKGGIGKIFAGTKKIYDDTGWIISGKNCVLSTNGPSNAEVFDNVIKINGCFYKRRSNYQTSATLLALRASNALGFSHVSKELLRRRLISRNAKSQMQFARTLTIADNELLVEDQFWDQQELSMDSNFSYLYTTGIGLYKESERFRIYTKACNKIKIKFNDNVTVLEAYEKKAHL